MRDRSLKIAVVGACHMDRKARAEAPYTAGASNPVTLQTCRGGVARNVAENLSRLGAEVDLVTRLGQDSEGDALLASLTELPVGRAGISRSQTAPTAFHLIALQPDGEMMVAMADMRIYDEITAKLLQGLPEGIWAADAVFADCNLPPATLAFLAGLRRANRRFAVVGVSPAKVLRLKDCLPACDLLCVNQGEAAALLERPPERLGPQEAAALLQAAGVDEVVVTLGAAGLCLAAGGEVLSLPGRAAAVQDVTGAGDALAAAYLEARLRGLAPALAGRQALAAARLTVESDKSVSPKLSPRMLEELAAP